MRVTPQTPSAAAASSMFSTTHQMDAKPLSALSDSGWSSGPYCLNSGRIRQPQVSSIRCCLGIASRYTPRWRSSVMSQASMMAAASSRPRSERTKRIASKRAARSLSTTNSHSRRWLLLGALRPAPTMRSITSGSTGRSSKSRTVLLAATAS